ncbi:MAG: NAD-dependent epimerase/dehydratase family protein [Solirubrobacterales bacterium]
MPGNAAERHVLIAGGAGYIGSVLTRELLARGFRVRVLDSLLYGNGESLAGVAEHELFSFVRGDVRSSDDLRAALEGISDVVLLASLVGDPVCKRNPELATEVNLGGARNVLGAAGGGAVERLIFASTCSNYGLRPDEEPAKETDDLHPLSLYAETKVEMEREILGRAEELPFAATVLRLATAFGISPRMRFDLTVSEFTRELVLGGELEVYDADTWRPYCHVGDISAAIVTALVAPVERVRGEVFNVGGDEGNHTKRSIVEAALDALGGEGEVTWTEGGVDARNYRVSFAKIGERLGFAPGHTVPGSIVRLAGALRAGMFDDVEQRPLYYRNFQLDQASVPAASPRGEPSAAGAGEGRGGGDAG